jgi:hypothetical protein
MHQAIQFSISDGWIADVFMPVFDGELGSHDGGSQSVTALYDLQKVPPLLRVKGDIRAEIAYL